MLSFNIVDLLGNVKMWCKFLKCLDIGIWRVKKPAGRAGPLWISLINVQVFLWHNEILLDGFATPAFHGGFTTTTTTKKKIDQRCNCSFPFTKAGNCLLAEYFPPCWDLAIFCYFSSQLLFLGDCKRNNLALYGLNLFCNSVPSYCPKTLQEMFPKFVSIFFFTIAWERLIRLLFLNPYSFYLHWNCTSLCFYNSFVHFKQSLSHYKVEGEQMCLSLTERLNGLSGQFVWFSFRRFFFFFFWKKLICQSWHAACGAAICQH